jgi:IclR family pca regulon transcriptional regulator
VSLRSARLLHRVSASVCSSEYPEAFDQPLHRGPLAPVIKEQEAMPRTSKTNPDSGDWARSVPSLHEPRYSQSLERGLAILACFTPEHPILGIADIAEQLGMSRSTTHRYVITLVALGYLEQGASRKYRLGLRVTDLGMSALNSTGLREHSRPHLQELRQRTTYTVNLAVLDGPEILYVDRARSYRRGQTQIDLDLHPGSRLPAYCTSMGKLLLAHLPETEQRDMIGEMKLTRRAPNSITSKKALRNELDHVREEGFAVNDQELAEGLHSISAPVRTDSNEVVAAVNMAAHSSMISLEELVEHLGPHLITTADRISARLGYRRNDERD